LADFQATKGEYDGEEISILAGSVDPLDKTKELVEKLGVTYPVAYGMDAEAVCGKTGAFYESERKFIQPACFLLRPDKTIEMVTYSSGPVGRFVAKDVLDVVKFYKSRAKK
jgi:peroxiredoxin